MCVAYVCSHVSVDVNVCVAMCVYVTMSVNGAIYVGAGQPICVCGHWSVSAPVCLCVDGNVCVCVC